MEITLGVSHSQEGSQHRLLLAYHAPWLYDVCQKMWSMPTLQAIPSLPIEVYHPQNNPWQFMQCAIDLVGHTSLAPAKKDMMIMATSCFTKLIKVEVLSSTKKANVGWFL